MKKEILHNKYNRETLVKMLQNDTRERQTLSFYKYVKLVNVVNMRDTLYKIWSDMGVLGRIYLAEEGINAQLSIPKINLEAFKTHISSIPEFHNVPFKYAVEEPKNSFIKLIIKVKNKIVADGITDKSFDVENSGTHINAVKMHTMMHNGAMVIDMRNHYEAEIGRFDGAWTPKNDTFRDVIDEAVEYLQTHNIPLDTPLITYCTGGIRCEKASAVLKYKGYNNTYQLDGGIIQYAHECRNNNLQPLFRGTNFVFDERLSERITDDIISTCHSCHTACDTHINCKNDACHLLYICCESCQKSMDGYCSELCYSLKDMMDSDRRRAYRDAMKHRKSELNVYNKSHHCSL